MNRFFAIIAALAALGGAPIAQAATREDGPSATIRYGDLNLDSLAGQAELERRIEAALRQLCPLVQDVGSNFANHRQVQQCKAAIRDKVRAALPA